MPFVTVGETSVFYTVSGRRGPAVVLIHGAGGSHLHWPAGMRRLPGAAVYAVDLPGHGRSGGEGRTRIEDYAADILGFMDGVGIGRGVLVGHSMGGAIAQMTALLAPDRVAGLVLVGTGAKLRVAPALLEGILQDYPGVLGLMAEWAWGPGADPALVARGRQMMARVPSRVVWGDFAACDGANRRFAASLHLWERNYRVRGKVAPNLKCARGAAPDCNSALVVPQ